MVTFLDCGFCAITLVTSGGAFPWRRSQDCLKGQLVDAAGQSGGILFGMDKWEVPDETSFWLGVGESREIVAQARAEVSEGQGLTQEQIWAEFGKPNPSA